MAFRSRLRFRQTSRTRSLAGSAGIESGQADHRPERSDAGVIIPYRDVIGMGQPGVTFSHGASLELRVRAGPSFPSTSSFHHTAPSTLLLPLSLQAHLRIGKDRRPWLDRRFPPTPRTRSGSSGFHGFSRRPCGWSRRFDGCLQVWRKLPWPGSSRGNPARGRDAAIARGFLDSASGWMPAGRAGAVIRVSSRILADFSRARSDALRPTESR